MLCAIWTQNRFEQTWPVCDNLNGVRAVRDRLKTSDETAFDRLSQTAVYRYKLYGNQRSFSRRPCEAKSGMCRSWVAYYGSYNRGRYLFIVAQRVSPYNVS